MRRMLIRGTGARMPRSAQRPMRQCVECAWGVIGGARTHMYRIANPKKSGSEPMEKSNTPAARLRRGLPDLLQEVRFARLSSRFRDDLLTFLPGALVEDGLTAYQRNQRLVLRVIEEAGGKVTHEALRRRVNAMGMSRVRRHEAIRALLKAGRIEEIRE